MRYANFPAESLRQKYRDTRVIHCIQKGAKSIAIHESIHDTRGGGRGTGRRRERGRRKAVKMWKKSKFKFTKVFDFFLLNFNADAMVVTLHYPSNVRAHFVIGRVLYSIRYSSCRVDTRYRPDSCIAIHESSITLQPYQKGCHSVPKNEKWLLLGNWLLHIFVYVLFRGCDWQIAFLKEGVNNGAL